MRPLDQDFAKGGVWRRRRFWRCFGALGRVWRIGNAAEMNGSTIGDDGASTSTKERLTRPVATPSIPITAETVDRLGEPISRHRSARDLLPLECGLGQRRVHRLHCSAVTGRLHLELHRRVANRSTSCDESLEARINNIPAGT